MNRWKKTASEVDTADADHSSWHKLYYGTASDKHAHEDMHREQFKDAQAKRDKACAYVT